MKDSEYLDTFHDEMRGDAVIADSFYDDALAGIEDFENELAKWKKTLDDKGFSELSSLVIKGVLDIDDDVALIRRNLRNFLRTNSLIRKKTTKILQ